MKWGTLFSVCCRGLVDKHTAFHKHKHRFQYEAINGPFATHSSQTHINKAKCTPLSQTWLSSFSAVILKFGSIVPLRACIIRLGSICVQFRRVLQCFRTLYHQLTTEVFASSATRLLCPLLLTGATKFPDTRYKIKALVAEAFVWGLVITCLKTRTTKAPVFKVKLLQSYRNTKPCLLSYLIWRTSWLICKAFIKVHLILYSSDVNKPSYWQTSSTD